MPMQQKTHCFLRKQWVLFMGYVNVNEYLSQVLANI